MNSAVIDTENGALQIGEIRIAATATLDEARHLLRPDENAIWDVRTGYMWIYVRQAAIDEKSFTFSLCFYQGRLCSAQIVFRAISRTGKTKPWSWDDWSEEEELRDKRRYNQWLDETIGKKRKFSWSNVAACYDRKSGFSSIEIRYVNKFLDALFGKTAVIGSAKTSRQGGNFPC
jgi:hypothetical protein